MTIPEDLDVPEIKEITKDKACPDISGTDNETAQAVAGQPSEADDLRRAGGKKKAEEMETKERIYTGAMEKDIPGKSEAIFHNR